MRKSPNTTAKAAGEFNLSINLTKRAIRFAPNHPTCWTRKGTEARRTPAWFGPSGAGWATGITLTAPVGEDSFTSSPTPFLLPTPSGRLSAYGPSSYPAYLRPGTVGAPRGAPGVAGWCAHTTGTRAATDGAQRGGRMGRWYVERKAGGF